MTSFVLVPKMFERFFALVHCSTAHVTSNLHLRFSQESRAYPFSPASVVLVNDALQLFLALFAVSLRVGLSSLFHDGSLVPRLGWRRTSLKTGWEVVLIGKVLPLFLRFSILASRYTAS